MKKLRTKWIVVLAILMIVLLPNLSLATNIQIQILKKANEEYLIYVKGHLDSSFEFAFSNDKNAVKENLTYKSAATDTMQEDKNNIAYVDSQLYHTYFDQPTYLWARTIEGDYFAEGIEVDLQQAVEQKQVDLVNAITHIIKVDTKNTITTTETIEDVKVTRTVGKVDVKEEGTTYYQLIRLPGSQKENRFMELAQQIANNKVEDTMYAKLEIANEFSALYEELLPSQTSSQWVEVENDIILQPEDSKNGEQYILWLKNENSGEVKTDTQFLTCFEDYKPEVISEKMVTKLPITSDNPILFIILAVLIVLFIVVVIFRGKASDKQKQDKRG